MTQSEEWTVARLLAWTTEYLERQGSESPRLDAEVLLGHACGVPRIQLYARFRESVSENTRSAFRELVKRRAAGEPVAYLVGFKEFYSLSFRVTPDVLVPRPDTETLVLEALERCKASEHQPPRVLELGVGSGAISVCLAKYGVARVTAVDISPPALQVAKANAESHGVLDQIDFLDGDLFAPVPTDTTFDMVVSNPPYVSQAEFDELSPEVRDFEPKLALLSGPKGTEFFERIATAAPQWLVPGGWALVEVSPMIADACVGISESAGGYSQVDIVRDLGDAARVIRMRTAAA